MGYAPFPFSDWGGIDLRAEADEASGALDLLNVDLDRQGAVRTRDGFSKLNVVANAVSFTTGPFNWSAQSWLVAQGSDVKVYVYDNAGTQGSPSAAMSSLLTSVAEFGTGTTSYLYLAQGHGASVFRADTTPTFSTPAGMPNADHLAVQPSDNRLVAGYTSATAKSRVKFSDPGDAETWGANNYVDLTPNDGDIITGMVAWGNQLFVFKRNKFFVFPGNSTDGSGNPVFNYRAVDSGVGAVQGYASSCVAAPDGVYFMSAQGVYRTTGGAPQKVSGAIEPLFTGAAMPYGTAVGPLSLAQQVSATYIRNRIVFVVVDAAGSQYVLIYDIDANVWLLWQPAVTTVGICTFVGANGSTPRLCLASGTSLYTQPYTTGLTTTTDDGTPIRARYRSPYVNLNYIRRQRKWLPITSQESTVRETILDGTGTVGYSLARDWATSLPTTGGGRKGIVKLGGSVPAQGRHRYAQRGRAMSFQLETPTASDSFGSNTIANYTADAGATSNVSITGGVMDAAANFSTQNDLILTTGTFTDFGDSVSTVKINVGATRTNFLAGRLLKRVAAASRIAVYLFDDGAASTLRIATTASGLVSTTALTRISASTSYWIRARIDGNVITAEFFTADPASSVAANTGTYTLTGANATTYGSGIVGKTGLVFAPQETTASLDDSSVVGGAWKVEDLVWHLTGVRQSGVETT